MSASVTVAFACNDDRGCDTGRIKMVNIDSHEYGDVGLCCQMPRGQAIRRIGPIAPSATGVVSIFVGRRAFGAKGWREHYGNLSWSATAMEPFEAERLLRHLLASGYTVDSYDCDTRFAAIIEQHLACSSSSGDAGTKEDDRV